MFFPVPPPNEPRPPWPPTTPTRFGRLRAWGRQHPWRFTAWFVVVVLGLASVMPVWTAWYFSPWEANGEPATFWEMIRSAWTAGDSWHMRPSITGFYWPEAVKLAVLVVLSAIIGRCYAGNPEVPDAADYDDRITPPHD